MNIDLQSTVSLVKTHPTAAYTILLIIFLTWLIFRDYAKLTGEKKFCIDAEDFPTDDDVKKFDAKGSK